MRVISKIHHEHETDHDIDTLSTAITCTSLHTATPRFTTPNIVTFEQNGYASLLGEESCSSVFELSTSINSTDFSCTSHHGLYASFSTPVHVVFEDTIQKTNIDKSTPLLKAPYSSVRCACCMDS